MTKEEILFLKNYRPLNWKPECSSVKCYINKQHPSTCNPWRSGNNKFSESTPSKICTTSWIRKREVICEFFETLRYYIKSIIKPRVFKEPYTHWNSTRWQSFIQACRHYFGIRIAWYDFWHGPNERH
jgi:hypothetical protein